MRGTEAKILHFVRPPERVADSAQEFSLKAREALERKGFIIYRLTGQSIGSLRADGKPFSAEWHQERSGIESLPSRLSEVAINPNRIFIPNSDDKTLKEQERMVKKFSRHLRVHGAEAVIGEMADYVELAFSHLERTGVRLFGEADSYGFARTRTRAGVDRQEVLDVGSFGGQGGLTVSYTHPEVGDYAIRAVPIVVPKSA